MQNSAKININFDNYTIEQYKTDLDNYGLEIVWDQLLRYCIDNTPPTILNVDNFGELYEIGLAHTNKIAKKEMGKYFTPPDVAKLMANWLSTLQGENVCDVCCGTGNLILSYLKNLDKKDLYSLLNNKRIFLYDIDSLALKICLYSIGIIYGKEYMKNVTVVDGDFLNRNVVLPASCKVISNPPYYKIKEIDNTWENTDVIKKSKEFYSSIMEKIVTQSNASVIITPYSFIGGEKFYPLREKLNNYNGFIVSFDNVPGSIFSGKKHGIFNSNNTNSVRAAITVVENKADKKGFKLSPLIRFKNSEKEKLLNATTLGKYVSDTYQIIDDNNKAYYKCFPSLIPLFNNWIDKSDTRLRDIVAEEKTEYSICVPNSCRYFTVASVKDLKRTGKNTLYFKNEIDRNLSYCLINSSFAYWHWRLYDGGITYPVGLLLNLPIFFNSLSISEKEKLNEIAKEMQSVEENYLSYKKNAGEMQENIKFPEKYRQQINEVLLKVIGKESTDKKEKITSDIFDVIHSNSAFDSTTD